MKTDVYFLVFSAVFLFFCMAFFVVFLFIHNRDKQKANAIDKEKMVLVFNEELLKAQLEIQEQAFRNISQEIHDNIGQVLSIAKMNLGTLDFTDPEKLEQKTGDSRELVAKAIRDLRDLSHSLHPDYLSDIGLLSAVQNELEILKRSGKYMIRLDLTGEPVAFDSKKELILFRIFQEIINNILKHAQATTIDIVMEYGAAFFSLTVTDNGKGIEAGTGQIKFVSGLGIKNMQNRALLIGATFSIQHKPGEGLAVSIRLPFMQN